MLKDMDLAAAQEVARDVVRYMRHGADLSTISWNGPAIAEFWFARDQEREQLLRRMVEADNDPDAWVALNLIAARLHEERRKFPPELADWACRLHKGEIGPPPKPQSNKGQPPYAHYHRNRWFEQAFFILWIMGLPRMACYEVIATECDAKARTVSEGIKAARRSYWPPLGSKAIYG